MHTQPDPPEHGTPRHTIGKTPVLHPAPTSNVPTMLDTYKDALACRHNPPTQQRSGVQGPTLGAQRKVTHQQLDRCPVPPPA